MSSMILLRILPLLMMLLGVGRSAVIAGGNKIDKSVSSASDVKATSSAQVARNPSPRLIKRSFDSINDASDLGALKRAFDSIDHASDMDEDYEKKKRLFDSIEHVSDMGEVDKRGIFDSIDHATDLDEGKRSAIAGASAAARPEVIDNEDIVRELFLVRQLLAELPATSTKVWTATPRGGSRRGARPDEKRKFDSIEHATDLDFIVKRGPFDSIQHASDMDEMMTSKRSKSSVTMSATEIEELLRRLNAARHRSLQQQQQHRHQLLLLHPAEEQVDDEVEQRETESQKRNFDSIEHASDIEDAFKRGPIKWPFDSIEHATDMSDVKKRDFDSIEHATDSGAAFGLHGGRKRRSAVGHGLL